MRMAFLRENYRHELANDGDVAWLAKHRRYALKEAAAQLVCDEAHPWSHLWARDPMVRRRALKQFSYRLPCRPAARFLYQYGLRGGFLDGRAGWHYCRLLARYERFVQDALRQLRRNR